jgi:large subunit ribosomal protein L19
MLLIDPGCVIGLNFDVQSPIVPHDGVQAYGFCTKALAVRGFSTVGAAEVSVEDEDSSSPMVEQPPRIKFKRPDKTARHIMNVSQELLSVSL